MSLCTLKLVSCSREVGAPADCDLLFDLGGGPRAGGEGAAPRSRLLEPGETAAWAGRTITPLRDR